MPQGWVLCVTVTDTSSWQQLASPSITVSIRGDNSQSLLHR